MHLRTDSRAAANSTLAIGGVSSPLDSFVVAESFVLRINICCKNPAHRQSAKRCPKCSLRSHFGQRKTDLRREALASLALRTTTDLRPLLSQRRKSVFRCKQA
jgi:hypothetical protein